MRINRLDLTRYGRFTDQSFDFGSASAGKADLHIIYGPNEAGKSTTFSALLDLLFGIEHKSPYNFLHPYPSMKIGAALQMQSGAQELVRIKSRLNSLQDETGRALPDTLITAELGDIDRAAYRMMFSLDDDTLEQGGEAILASKGNLGELLFSASAGLAGLSQNLTKLRGQSELFYKANARSGELADLKARLHDIETKKAELDAKSSAQAYAKLAEAHRNADADYQQASHDHIKTRSRISELEAMLQALPRLHRLYDLREQLRAYADLAETPYGWAEELPKLVIQDVELRTRNEALKAEITKLETELSALVPDETALLTAGMTENLQVLRARYLTVEKDLPEREITLHGEQKALQATIKRLGQPADTDPTGLLINIQTETELRRLIESRSGIDAALVLMKKELQAAQDKLTASSEMQQTTGIVYNSAQVASISALAQLLARLRNEDHTAFLRQTEINARNEEAELRELLQIMPHMQLDTDGVLEPSLNKLVFMTVPERADVEKTGSELQKLRSDLKQAESGLEDYRKETVQLEARLAALSQNTLLVTEEEALNLRQLRNKAWQQHRQILDTDSADQFETVLSRDDKAVHSRLTQADALARAAEIQQSLAVLAAQTALVLDTKTSLGKNLGMFEKQLQHWQQQILPEYQAVLSAVVLERWLEKREQILHKRQSWLRACRTRDDKRSEIKTAETALIKAVQQTGATSLADNLADLIIEAASICDQFNQLAMLQKSQEEQKLELQKRQKDADEVAFQYAQWQEAWALACKKSWLGQSGTVPDIDQVREILNLTGELAPALERSADMFERIGKMRQDQAAFRTEIEMLAHRLQLSLVSKSGNTIPLLEIAAQIENLVQAARQQQLSLVNLNKRLEQTRQDMNELAQRMAVVEIRKTDMLRHFDAQDLTEVGQNIQASNKKSALKEAVENEAQVIIGALKSATLVEAELTLSHMDSTEVKSSLQNLQALDERQDQHKQEQYRLWKQAEQGLREADNTDNSSAQLDEQRRTLLLEIEERSKRYLRLRFGISAAEQALRLYRDQHRSTMMARASEAFATISQGAYRQLTTQVDKDSEILIAIAADGSSKTAEELSKGTRFQLYLALRVAGYYEFVHAQRPMPFIADDIMETFDDDRSRETFQIFGQMARHGQVIYLTHHQHLCDIARDVCPDIRMHELTPRQMT